MMGGFHNRAAAYAKVGVETGVNTADPHQLILMLFDGALLQVRTASIAIGKQDIAAKGAAISKAIEIIVNGLKVSLDTSAGGELAHQLAALYDYMSDRLLYANLHSSQPAVEEVGTLLASLREAWAEIRSSAQLATA